MIILVTMAALVLVSCMAAAGLIATTQNMDEASRTLGAIDLGEDARV